MATLGVVVELRKSRRYKLEAPVLFLWERPDGVLEEDKGTIRDISDRGVFISVGVAPAVGSHVDIDVYLPSSEITRGSVHLHGEGIVVRLEREMEGAKGFAATVAFQTEGASGPTMVNPKTLQ
jgi:PilZ domain